MGKGGRSEQVRYITQARSGVDGVLANEGDRAVRLAIRRPFLPSAARYSLFVGRAAVQGVCVLS